MRYVACFSQKAPPRWSSASRPHAPNTPPHVFLRSPHHGLHYTGEVVPNIPAFRGARPVVGFFRGAGAEAVGRAVFFRRLCGARVGFVWTRVGLPRCRRSCAAIFAAQGANCLAGPLDLGGGGGSQHPGCLSLPTRTSYTCQELRRRHCTGTRDRRCVSPTMVAPQRASTCGLPVTVVEGWQEQSIGKPTDAHFLHPPATGDACPPLLPRLRQAPAAGGSVTTIRPR